MKNKTYRFTTIVATENNRANFTKLREELNSSDKELFEAIWNTFDAEKVREEVARLQAVRQTQRDQAKIERQAAKLAEMQQKLKSAAA